MDIWGGHSWFPLGIQQIEEEEEDGKGLVSAEIISFALFLTSLLLFDKWTHNDMYFIGKMPDWVIKLHTCKVYACLYVNNIQRNNGHKTVGHNKQYLLWNETET